MEMSGDDWGGTKVKRCDKTKEKGEVNKAVEEMEHKGWKAGLQVKITMAV